MFSHIVWERKFVLVILSTVKVTVRLKSRVVALCHLAWLQGNKAVCTSPERHIAILA